MPVFKVSLENCKRDLFRLKSKIFVIMFDNVRLGLQSENAVQCWFHVSFLYKSIQELYFSCFCSRLDANHLQTVPEDSFEGLQQLRHLWLDDNHLTDVPVGSLRHQENLQALTLALNRILYIPDNAFVNLTSLVVL